MSYGGEWKTDVMLAILIAAVIAVFVYGRYFAR